MPRKDFPGAKIHYSPDLWQALWKGNLAFHMNGRSGKQGACPSGEVIKITAESGGCSRGILKPRTPIENPAGITPQAAFCYKTPPKPTFLSRNRKVDDYQVEMQTKVLPTISAAPYGAKNSTGVKKKLY